MILFKHRAISKYKTSKISFQFQKVEAYLIYTAGKTKIGRKYNKVVYTDSNTMIPGVTEGSTGCKIEKRAYWQLI